MTFDIFKVLAVNCVYFFQQLHFFLNRVFFFLNCGWTFLVGKILLFDKNIVQFHNLKRFLEKSVQNNNSSFFQMSNFFKWIKINLFFKHHWSFAPIAISTTRLIHRKQPIFCNMIIGRQSTFFAKSSISRAKVNLFLTIYLAKENRLVTKRWTNYTN